MLQHSFSWSHLSAIGGITWWNVYFQLHRGAIKARELIGFLKHLRRHIRRKLLIVWDRLPAHRSVAVRDFVNSLKGAISIEYLPAYAPELNPIEYLWGYWKQHELPNFCPRDFAELSHVALHKLKRIRRRRKRLIVAFWKQSDLPFPRL